MSRSAPPAHAAPLHHVMFTHPYTPSFHLPRHQVPLADARRHLRAHLPYLLRSLPVHTSVHTASHIPHTSPARLHPQGILLFCPPSTSPPRLSLEQNPVPLCPAPGHSALRPARHRQDARGARRCQPDGRVLHPVCACIVCYMFMHCVVYAPSGVCMHCVSYASSGLSTHCAVYVHAF